MNDLMCARVHEFADGELGAATAGSFRWHLASCSGCQLELESILALRAMALEGLGALARSMSERPAANVIDPRTGAASRATMEVELAEPVRGRARAIGVRIAYASLPVMAAAGMAGVWVARGPAPLATEDPVVNAAFAGLASGGRPRIERFAYAPADRYRPPAPVMRGGERVPVVPSQALARLEEREDRHGLAVLWMAAGQWDAAEALLQRMPPSPELDQERAVLDLHRGRLALAERRLLAVLRARPQLAAARWNLGLLYQRQGQRQLARQAFIRVAALSEPGWAVEAQRRARELEQPSANPVQVPAR